MRGHWLLADVWKLEYDCSQLFFSEGSGEEVFIGDMGLNVLLCAELSRFWKSDESFFKLGSEDLFW